jgi:hypothetical protein
VISPLRLLAHEQEPSVGPPVLVSILEYLFLCIKLLVHVAFTQEVRARHVVYELVPAPLHPLSDAYNNSTDVAISVPMPQTSTCRVHLEERQRLSGCSCSVKSSQSQTEVRTESFGTLPSSKCK